jgi:hypothetical protein
MAAASTLSSTYQSLLGSFLSYSSSKTHSMPYPSSLHVMHTTVPRPRLKPLTIEVEDNATCTPQENQRHVQHNRRYIAGIDDPRRDELAEAVAP